MNDYITTTKQSTTKPCAYFLGYTVSNLLDIDFIHGDIHGRSCKNHIYMSVNMPKSATKEMWQIWASIIKYVYIQNLLGGV